MCNHIARHIHGEVQLLGTVFSICEMEQGWWCSLCVQPCDGPVANGNSALLCNGGYLSCWVSAANRSMALHNSWQVRPNWLSTRR